MSLFWYTTSGHLDDWFVVARSERSAVRWLREEEDVETIEKVMDVPEAIDVESRRPHWPRLEFLVQLGGTVVRSKQPRCVTFGDRTFAEGMYEAEANRVTDDICESEGLGRPNRTHRTDPE